MKFEVNEIEVLNKKSSISYCGVIEFANVKEIVEFASKYFNRDKKYKELELVYDDEFDYTEGFATFSVCVYPKNDDGISGDFTSLDFCELV